MSTNQDINQSGATLGSFAGWQAEELAGADVVFVSDVHLHDEQDRRAQLLLLLIKACQKSNVKKFILGGDIFEFFWARSDYFLKKFSFLFRALRDLSTQGTQVYFVQGNHEYCMEEITLEGIAILEADGMSSTLEVNGKSIKIGFSHGDLLNAPGSYLKFKAILNSKVFKFFFSMVPSILADNFAMNVAHQSRKGDKYRRLYHTPIVSSAVDRAKREGEKIHLFGHFHYPYQCEHEGTQVICVPSWDLPNALVYREDKFTRLIYKEDEIKSKQVEFKTLSDYESI
jgi:UDP-2,3-diacylglucosamine hydrolase